jgi:hypothetical protein
MNTNDWEFAQANPAEQLAKVQYFSMKKIQEGAEIEMTITVKEFSTPPYGALRFFAQADKQTNQKVAPYTPSGWGSTLLEALTHCVKEINRFPCEDQVSKS